MSTLELPKSLRSLIAISLATLAAATYRVFRHEGANLPLAVMAFFVSGFLADLFTGLGHFGFDYVWPEKMPILGPIAKEFREHHEYPTLDPSSYAENLTKGSYPSLPLSTAVIWLTYSLSPGGTSFVIVAVLLGLSWWAFFFHQIHSYAHMGCSLAPDELHKCIKGIRELPTQQEQVREFAKLFEAVPIPPVIRFLQRSGVILNPAKHNLHHVLFETDFSSINGW